MMVFKFFSKIKYRCLIGLLGCIVLFVTGCGTADEAIVLIPPGESVAEFPELEAAEQAAETRVAEPQTVYVYVCGAVRTPGVVEVPEGRIEDRYYSLKNCLLTKKKFEGSRLR